MKKEEPYLGYIIYELTNLESGQCVRGEAAALSKLIGIPKCSVSYHAREGVIYKKKYQFRKLGEKKIRSSIKWEWDEMHRIYLELVAGERYIRKAADGKRYAVKVS